MQVTNDEDVNNKIKEAKEIYEKAMFELDELDKAQKEILEREKRRTEQKKIDRIKQDINNNYKN